MTSVESAEKFGQGFTGTLKELAALGVQNVAQFLGDHGLPIETGNARVGVQAIIIDQEDRVLLQLRSGDRYGSGEWGLVGGMQEKGETIVEAILREVQEEIGVEVQDKDLGVAVVVDTMEPQDIHHVQLGFVIRSLSNEPYVKEQEKSAELRYFQLDSLPDNLFGPSRAVLEAYEKSRGKNVC